MNLKKKKNELHNTRCKSKKKSKWSKEKGVGVFSLQTFHSKQKYVDRTINLFLEKNATLSAYNQTAIFHASKWWNISSILLKWIFFQLNLGRFIAFCLILYHCSWKIIFALVIQRFFVIMPWNNTIC